MTEFFDAGESRTLPWARRAEAAALVAALADPDRGWDAIVIGEYERAFYRNQYAMMAPMPRCRARGRRTQDEIRTGRGGVDAADRGGDPGQPPVHGH